MDSLRRKYFDCTHCTDAAVDKFDGAGIGNKLDFYHQFAAALLVTIVVDHKLFGHRNIDLIRDADNLIRFVVVVADFVTYWALYEQSMMPINQYFLVVDLLEGLSM